MKKLEIIIKPEKLEDLKEVLDSCEVNISLYIFITVCQQFMIAIKHINIPWNKGNSACPIQPSPDTKIPLHPPSSGYNFSDNTAHRHDSRHISF